MALVALDRNKILYYPLDWNETRGSVTVRFSHPKNNQKNVLLAENLTFENAIRSLSSVE